MCAPFVIGQVSSRLQTIAIDDFSPLKKLTSYALLPYHLGRITTYCFIGFLCSFLTKIIADFFAVKIFSTILLTSAAVIFCAAAFDKKLFPKIKIFTKIKILPIALFSSKINSSYGLNGYILGIILGFIPCGLLYGAFLLASTIHNPTFAIIGMFCFGLSTFPALFLVGLSGHFLKKIRLKIFTKIILLINALLLFLMALNLFNQ